MADELSLKRIESLSQMDNRPSLNDAIEYTSNSGTPVKPVEKPKVKLLRKATDEDIYELKSRVTVKKMWKGDEPKSRLSDVRFKDTESLLEGIYSDQGKFKGLYVLFWWGVAVLTLDICVNYYLEHGFSSEIVEYLVKDLIWIGLTDLWMYCSMYFVFGLQVAVKAGWIKWDKSGWVLASIYEVGFVLLFMWFAEHHNFPWIGKIFLFLHSLVMLMKMHSYSFYNGYLWNIYNELTFSQGFLKKNTDLAPHIAELLDKSVKFCSYEIASQSKTTTFPANITVENFFMYTMFPTVVYQIDYPRTPKIRWKYVAGKLCAIFGVISLMVVLAQHSMYPLAMRAISLSKLPLAERMWFYPKLLLDLMPPFLLMYIFVFYLIWDAILNAIAELTRFGDREFYGDWWNCVSWDEFARLWNVPVHKFLLRHVYHSSISAFNCSKTSATLITFFISSVVHELAMYVLFHRLRGYLLLLQMFQLPLAAMTKTKWMRDKPTFGNVFFWFGIATGPSLMCTLYLTF